MEIREAAELGSVRTSRALSSSRMVWVVPGVGWWPSAEAAAYRSPAGTHCVEQGSSVCSMVCHVMGVLAGGTRNATWAGGFSRAMARSLAVIWRSARGGVRDTWVGSVCDRMRVGVIGKSWGSRVLPSTCRGGLSVMCIEGVGEGVGRGQAEGAVGRVDSCDDACRLGGVQA